MSTPIETTHDFEVSVMLRGSYQPFVPEQGPTYASGGQPSEPAHIEDAEVLSLVGDRLVPAPPAERGSHPEGVWQEVDLLDGIDAAARARVMANLLAFLGERTVEEVLMEAVADSAL